MGSFLRLAAAGAAAALLLAGAAAPARAAPYKDLTVVSWGGDYTRSQMLAYVKPFRRRSGEWVAMETYNGGLDEIRRQVSTANVVWDVVDFVLADLIQGCREGLLEKIDHARLAAGRDGNPASQDFIPGALTECGVGQMVWATVVGYDGGRFEGERPTRLADFFDTRRFPGKRGLRRGDPRVTLEWALMADGVAPDRVYAVLETEAGQERAFGVLDGIRPHIVWWESGSEPVALLDSGEVAMTSVWNGRMYRPVVDEGKDYAIVWDGQVWDIDSWGILKGTENLDKAMEFIRFATSPGSLAEQVRHISYGPARTSAMALVDGAVRPMLPTAAENMAGALQMDAAWWATHQTALAAKMERWLAKGSRGPLGTAR